MRITSFGGRSLAAIALVALVVACDKESKLPTSPEPTSPGLTGPGPASPAQPAVTSVELSGPATMAPGESAQFTATELLSDGSRRVPTTIKWVGSAFLTVDASGLVTAGPLSGGANVSATVTTTGGVKGVSKAVLVQPTGTYFVTGTVSDAEFTATPIPGARIEVMPGTIDATADAAGYYRLYGVPPDATVRVTADGYEPREQTLDLAASARQNFQLALSGPRLNLAGAYTLTIDVTDGCPGSNPLSADLQHRRYDALLTANGLTVNGELTEPRFQLSGGRGNRFSGRVSASGASFTLGAYGSAWDWGAPIIYPDVAERLPNGTFLVVSGAVVTTGSAAGLSGTLEGGLLSNWDSRFPGDSYYVDPHEVGSCGGKIRFTLTRR